MLQASTSLGYCRTAHFQGAAADAQLNTGYKASIFGGSAACLALVEVAGKANTARYSGDIHVVQNHDGVVARYFFVYSSNSELPKSMNTDTMHIPAWDA